MVLDFSPEALALARGARRALSRRAAAPRTRISSGPGSTAREGVLASADSDAENLYITLSARDARPRADDRRARLRSRGRAEDPARRRRSGRAALFGGRDRDGQARSEAAGRGVPRSRLVARRAPTCTSRRSRCRRAAPRPAARFASCASAARPGRLIVALRKPDGTFDTTPKPDERIDAGDVADRDRHGVGAAGARGALCLIARSTASRLGDWRAGGLAGEVVLERPKDPTHGDYATNVALQARAAHKRPPREFAEELAEKVAALPEIDRADVAGPGFVNLWRGRLVPRRAALAEVDEATAAASRTRKSAFRSRWSRRTRPARSPSPRRGTAPTATASRVCSSSRGNDVDREYYYNDAGAQMERFRLSVEARRRGEEPPEDGYQGEYIAVLAQVEGDPVPAMLERIEATLERFRIHFDSWAKQSDLEREFDAILPELPTYEQDGAVFVALDGLRRRQGPRARPLSREGRPADLRGRRHRLPAATSSTAATTARSTSSAPTITASRAGSR